MKNNILLAVLMLVVINLNAQATANAAKHLGAGVVIGAVGGYAAHKVFKGSRGWMWAGAVGSSLAAGLAKETYDRSRSLEWENDDIVYTAIGGIISGLVLDMILDSKRGSGKRCGCPPLAFNMDNVNTDFVSHIASGSGDIVAAIQANHLINTGLQ
ncbi:hypothetical protein ACFQZJ_06275 [Maribacter chungangensis]|uniref:Glycine zipper 2TM domain-containing protein n=1 Tax=Maribacter chungangensis TaxID=1069117 RepID=A0ABW3B1B0_9FLAO